jgi:hypothetical protein
VDARHVAEAHRSDRIAGRLGSKGESIHDVPHGVHDDLRSDEIGHLRLSRLGEGDVGGRLKLGDPVHHLRFRFGGDDDQE